jgi:hypothetical protein
LVARGDAGPSLNIVAVRDASCGTAHENFPWIINGAVLAEMVDSVMKSTAFTEFDPSSVFSGKPRRR